MLLGIYLFQLDTLVSTQKSKGKVSLKTLIKLAKKYRVTPSGSRKKLAEGLSGLRGSYLSKSEINEFCTMPEKSHSGDSFFNRDSLHGSPPRSLSSPYFFSDHSFN